MPYKLAATIPHPGAAYGVAAVGNHVASICADGRVRVYNPWSGSPSDTLYVGRGARALALSGDGKLLACGGKAVGLYTTPGGKKVGAYKGHRQQVQAAAFSPSGGALITVSGEDRAPRDWTVRRWTVGTAEEHARWTEPAPVLSVATFSAYIATGSAASYLHLYDMATGRVVWQQTHTAWNYALAFTPDGRFLLSAGDTPGIRVLDAMTGRIEHMLQTDASARSLAISPDGAAVVLGANRYNPPAARVVVLDLASGEVLDQQPLMEGLMIQSVCFSPDGSRIYAAISGGRDSAPDGLRVYERAP